MVVKIDGKKYHATTTADGLIRFKRGGFWRYYRYNTRTGRYELTGTTLHRQD